MHIVRLTPEGSFEVHCVVACYQAYNALILRLRLICINDNLYLPCNNTINT